MSRFFSRFDGFLDWFVFWFPVFLGVVAFIAVCFYVWAVNSGVARPDWLR